MKAVVELGYIFDNRYWKQGYCTESVEACIRFAFDRLKLGEPYCSVRIAEKSGMEKVGEQIKLCKDKEMRHFVYKINH